jgi:hypothetical protein
MRVAIPIGPHPLWQFFSSRSLPPFGLATLSGRSLQTTVIFPAEDWLKRFLGIFVDDLSDVHGSTFICLEHDKAAFIPVLPHFRCKIKAEVCCYQYLHDLSKFWSFFNAIWRGVWRLHRGEDGRRKDLSDIRLSATCSKQKDNRKRP